MRSWLEAVLMNAWRRRGLLACLLWPLARLFEFLLARRMRQFAGGARATIRLPVPVLVVGNIFVGGTGKTPLVIWLVQQLRQAGWRPGVISRGYGSSQQQSRVVDPHMSAEQAGDEPLLIARRAACPVVVGRSRVAAANYLLAQFPDTDLIISDDGLQHYALARDIEIMLFDQRGIGNGWLLPAGPLREPPERRRDFTIFNLAAGQARPPLPLLGQPAFDMQLQPGPLYQLSQPQQRRELSTLAGQTVCAAAGIGHPQRFYQMLASYGIRPQPLALADHQVFNAHTFDQVQQAIILITEKDAVKCRQIATLREDQRIWVVPVEAQIDPAFAQQLLTFISEKKHGRTLA